MPFFRPMRFHSLSAQLALLTFLLRIQELSNGHVPYDNRGDARIGPDNPTRAIGLSSYL